MDKISGNHKCRKCGDQCDCESYAYPVRKNCQSCSACQFSKIADIERGEARGKIDPVLKEMAKEPYLA
jgi:hypothetical protein